MSWLRTALKISGPLVSIAGIHGSIVIGRPEFAVAGMTAGIGVMLIAALAYRESLSERIILAGMFVVFAGVSLFALHGDEIAQNVLLLPPVLIHVWMAYYFGRTLLPGKEPLITRFSRISRGTVPKELIRYSRMLTWIWTLFFVVFGAISIYSAVAMNLETWTWIVNIAGPGLAFALFLGEHMYRAVRYKRYGHNSPIRTLAILFKKDTWTAS